MPPLGTSTSVFGGVLNDAQLDALERSSVTCIEIVGLPQDQIERTHIRDRLAAARFRINSAHLPYGRALDVSQLDPAARANALETNVANLRLANSLGAGLVVVHPSAEPIADE